MNLTPYINAQDLSELLGRSNRSARRLMQRVVMKRPQLSWSADENLLKERDKCLAVHEVLQHTGLHRHDIYSHLEKVLIEPPGMHLREIDKVLKSGGKWHVRNMVFENGLQGTFAVNRYTYSYVPALDEAGSVGVFGFGMTSFPSLLFCHELNGYYGFLLMQSRQFKSLIKVLYNVAVNEELIGLLGKFCGRRKSVDEIVLVEAMGDLSEATFYRIVGALGSKLDRTRCLVFLPESMVPEHMQDLERIKGFRKLNGTGYLLAGSINKWVEVRMGLRFE